MMSTNDSEVDQGVGRNVVRGGFVCLAVLMLGASTATAVRLPSMWMDPVNEWRPHAAVAPGPSSGTAAVRQTIGGRDAGTRSAWQRGRVAIMVEAGVYPDISASLSTYATDLAQIGFSSVTVTVSGTAEFLRNELITLYSQPESLVGAVLVGDLPYVIFEMMEDWGYGPGYADFACDFYFMDLDGSWADVLSDPPVEPDNDKLDTWTGDRSLDIWASRINTANLPSLGSEVDLLNGYFARNHTARWDLLNNTRTGLVYPDDDWASDGIQDSANLEPFFGVDNVTTIMHVEATTADDYISQRLTADYQIDLIRSHGSPGGHGFYQEDHGVFEWVAKEEYTFHDPDAAFFSFFVCSGCDYTVADYLGGTAVFNPEGNGLLAWGSTKTGGMWNDHFMYQRMAMGFCIGEGFIHWFNQVKDYMFAPPWWYGMVLVGDGSLTEYPVDCNDNFILDDAEIPVSCGGTCTADCDPDCNCTGIPDACEGPDCNVNDVPDECEIPVSSGGLCTADCDPDCNANAIPDACETDCNGNGVPDDCDLTAGTSDDCNTNAIPDECEILGGGGVLLDEDFEAGPPPGWTLTGTFQLTDQCGDSHPNCGGSLWAYAGHTDSCYYGDDELGELIAPPVTLGYGLTELRFCSRIDTELGFDFGKILLNGTPAWEDSGAGGVWEEHIVNLEAFAGQTVEIVFEFSSDSAISGTLGWQVDNVYLFSQNMDCNTNSIPDDCDLAQGTSADLNGNGVPDECESAPPIMPASPDDTLKNRYVSFVPNNPGADVALTVDLTSSTYFPETSGMLGWVGEPFEAPEDPGVWISRVVDTPFYSGSWPAVVHLGDCEIVPVATYEIRSTWDGVAFSPPLTIETIAQPAPKYWADCVGALEGNAWTGPNGVLNMDDVVAAVQKFQDHPTAPPITWVDMHDQAPNVILNFDDIFWIVQGFKGESYPFSGPAECP